MSGPPPPPPPHGENPKTTSGGPNMPPGKYDIFIIPPHSSGSGFLYLPSLKPNVNSFAAGFASALVLVVLGHSMAPAFKTWWNGFQGMGSVGIMLLVVGVAIGSWVLGRTQTDSGPGARAGGGFGGNHGWGPNAGGGFNWAGAGGAGADAGGPPPPPPPHSSPPPKSGPTPGSTGGDKPNGSWQHRSHHEQPPREEPRPQPQEPPPPPKPKPQPKPEPKAQPPPPRPEPKAQPPPPPRPEPKAHPPPPPRSEPKAQPPPPKPQPKTQPPPPKPEPKPEPKAQPPPPKPAPKAQPSPTKPAPKAQPPPSKSEPKAQPPPPPKPEPKPEMQREPSTWEKAREEVKRKEALRKAKEAEEKRLADIAEVARKAKEAEEKRLAEVAEAERKRKEDQAEAERKAKEAEQKRKEEVTKRLKELREKEARERGKRDEAAKEKANKEAEAKAKLEKEAKDKADKEAKEKEQREQERVEQLVKEKLAKEKEVREARLREARERDLRERLEREKALREKLEKEAKEREANRQKEQEKAKEEAAEAQRKSTYAYSAKGEKFNPWPNGRPPSQPPSPATPNPIPNSTKRPSAPSARTYSGTADEDQYSYRPYDEPKRHSRRRSGETIFTESSYAPSQSTARTSPPPSMRGAYSTKDPNKIVIKAVYGFMNQFAKTPASQLLSGQGSVTDGLILRITTEGLFIDDDVRGVPQREWDVKAWTLKLMEVWCSSGDFATPTVAPPPKRSNVLHRPPPTRVDRGVLKVLTGDEADKFCESMLRTCKNDCRLCPHGDYEDSYDLNAGGQSGEWKQRGLHVLRANIRDQEGKRYMFVLGEEEGWKVALGLQRLRKGTQVRQLGVQAMPVHEARNSLEMLGWT
ncbi:hypothetical protein TruAng_004516 [Truncatella angustata]|nr:hypothetical protein TruAng_004516 [Truncatella angustata]